MEQPTKCAASQVDVMTYFAIKYSELPASQVFGSGTILDTTRLKDAIAQEAEVAPRAVHAYVIGEHGDSQTIAWSNITIGGIPLDQVHPLHSDKRQAVAEFVKFKADRLNKVKGETSFGIGAVVSSICTSILLDERHILPISHYQNDESICFSRPAVLGRKGIVRTLDIPLNETEKTSLQRSVEKLKEIVFAYSSDSAAPPKPANSHL